ncbi:recombination-associated protein RdgC [Aestuariirhabdus litorea]|uniref:Recombination-associated protein RdgC n=1 Tax=Aestuariirhabdus litorea TaxID=2528527 RepID=A0A3P3VPA4_9GAMM|nr:recombination-associated protein RdgC [Aestuariirhabdus litorea]RRJ84187.1 recombination-associated protein RdgC [Aestuariirhabdus litorea]RWW97408.1 recombination-associated protein RdgC [Endozoicomonadaceae bacterium GTF-13]
MWFKNLIIYRFTKPFTESAESLEAQLSEGRFRPCGKQELSSYGWVEPLGKQSDQLVHSTNGFLMLCARKEDRLLPASVVRERVAEKVQEIEAAEHRKVYKKERDSFKEEITFDLLPRAFTRNATTFAFIAPQQGLLLVDASSFKRAEELVSYLRGSLGSLPVVPPALKQAPASIMTQWLEQTPVNFELGDEAELSEPGDEGGVIRCKRHDLTAEEIKIHLEAGKQVNKLSLSWSDQLNFLLSDDFSLKRLRFGDEIQEQASDQGGDDAASRFDADFALMSRCLCDLVEALIEVLGGEDRARLELQA